MPSDDEKPEILKVKVPEGEEVRCPHWDEKLGRICNKLLFRGRPSYEPQEFKCRCGKKTVFKRLT